MNNPFNYNPTVYGGTEYVARTFTKLIYNKLDKLQNYQCLIMPGMIKPLSEIIKDNREIILWMHNTPTQFIQHAYDILRNKLFIKRVKYVVVPSNAAKALFLRDIPEYGFDKIYVINNGIEKMNYNADKFKNPKKIKLIHTSGPDRALPILMNSLQYVEEDFRLEIYNEFNPDLHPDAPIDKRVMFYGRTPRAAVKEAFESSHIFVYPSIFEETFCLSLTEGMSAGCLPVYSKIGSLEEIGADFGIHYEFNPDHDAHSKLFAGLLNSAILKIKNQEWDPSEQIEYVNNTFSWDAIEQQWAELHESL